RYGNRAHNQRNACQTEHVEHRWVGWLLTNRSKNCSNHSKYHHAQRKRKADDLKNLEPLGEFRRHRLHEHNSSLRLRGSKLNGSEPDQTGPNRASCLAGSSITVVVGSAAPAFSKNTMSSLLRHLRHAPAFPSNALVRLDGFYLIGLQVSIAHLLHQPLPA